METLNWEGEDVQDSLQTNEKEVREAFEKLKYEFMDLVMSVLVSSKDVDLDCLRLRINWFMSSSKSLTPEFQSNLDQLESLSTPQGVLNFLIAKRFIGYLNYELIKVFQKATKSDEMEAKIEDYEKKFKVIFRRFSFNTIMDVFKRHPQLSPVSIVGLPDFAVRLQSPWKGRSIYSLREILSQRFTLPPSSSITSITKGSERQQQLGAKPKDQETGMAQIQQKLTEDEVEQDFENEEHDVQLFLQECRKNGKIQIRPLKCILSGLPRVGKTSVLLRLQGKMPQLQSGEILPSSGFETPVNITILEPTQFSTTTINSKGIWVVADTLTKEGHVLIQQTKQKNKSNSSEFIEAVAYFSENSQHEPVETVLPTITEPARDVISQEPLDSEHYELKPFDDTREFISHVLTSEGLPSLEDLEDSITVYFMDTGGQPEFHELFPPILHGPALHLIFFNASVDLDKPVEVHYCHKEKGIAEIKYPTKSSSIEILQQLLSSFYSLQQQTESQQSMAVLLGSYIDQFGEDESLRRTKINEVSNRLLKDLESTAFYKNGFLASPRTLVEDKPIFLPIDNITASEKELEEIKEFLFNVFKDKKFKPITLPVTWAAFHLILRHKYEKSTGVCTLKECEDLAVSCGIDRVDVPEVLKYLHNKLGTILYYKDVIGLNKLVICDPNVLFRGLSHLVTVSFAGSGPYHSTAEEVRNTGNISKGLLDEAKSLSNKASLLTVEHLINLLTHYKLIRKINEQTYFMPSLLLPDNELMSSFSADLLSGRSLPPPLLITFKGGFIPVGVFSALVVQLLTHWEANSKSLYRNHVDFDAGSHIVELRSFFTFIEIRINASGYTSSSIYYQTCTIVMECLRVVLQTHHHTRITELFETFYCPGSSSFQHPHTCIRNSKGYLKCNNTPNKCKEYEAPFLLSDVQRVWFEESSSSSSGVDSPSLSVDVPRRGKRKVESTDGPVDESRRTTIEKRPKIVEVIQERKLQEKDLGDVLSETSKVSIGWFGFGLALGVLYKDLKDIEENHHDVQRCRIEMLKSWISLGHATWTKLVETLRSQNEVSVAEDIERKRFLI